MRTTIAATAILILTLPHLQGAEPAPGDGAGRWPASKAWAWYESRPWPVGCNFLPSTAVNDVEMWQKDTFDPATIDRELGWAEDLGFNSVRVFVNFVVWKDDAAGLKDRFGRFLALADRHGISTMPILFDDCFKPEPRAGKQDDPVPGVHNSQWVCSPGEKRVKDAGSWGDLESYVKGMVGAFGADRRVILWDLYNEPVHSIALVESTFRWAREAKASQPLTTCLFGGAGMPERIAAQSDIISFHNYDGLASLKGTVERLRSHGRPIICTEWMARTAGSRFPTHLPFFKEGKIGCWSWGLVAGRIQTYYPWGSPEGAPEPATWFHDILRKDGSPFSAREARAIRIITGRLKGSIPESREIVATARKAAVEWRYTMVKPAEGWFRPGFDDGSWSLGPAPFGSEEPAIDRHPRTPWKGSDIWLRRAFEMPAGAFDDLWLLLHHDEDTEVYIDGILAAKAGGYNAAYEPFDLESAARAALTPGRHVMAVHCHQTTGGQYIDVGIEGTVVAP